MVIGLFTAVRGAGRKFFGERLTTPLLVSLAGVEELNCGLCFVVSTVKMEVFALSMVT